MAASGRLFSLVSFSATFLLAFHSYASNVASPPVKEIKTFSESPRKSSSDPVMAELANIGRQISKLQKQIVDLNQSSFEGGERSQKIYLQVAELRFSGASRMVKQAELELEASRMEAEAMALDKKIGESQSQTLQKLRSEMSQKSAGFRLRASQARGQAGAIAIENSEAQMKVDRMYSEAHRESIGAAKARVQIVEIQHQVMLLEQKMQELTNQSQAKPNR
jgi:hypothetical protein